MKRGNVGAIVAFAVAALAGAIYCCFLEPVAESSENVAPDSSVAEDSLLTYDTVSVVRSFESWMIFSENFKASYRDSSFTGSYQLVYPLEGPYDSLVDSKLNRLLLSLFFGEHAPKTVDRRSVQAALDEMMKHDVETTHRWWNESKAAYGERWRDEVCGCDGFFYTMPTANTANWISFQQISDYRCGGNGGPREKYYTVVHANRSKKDPYVMDTTAFVPGFREKLVDMIADNVIFNKFARYDDDRISRKMIRQATAEEFKDDFLPVLTLSGVQFLFSTWALPFTSHADGRIPVIVPYRTIQEILTQNFKEDIGL